MYVLSFFFFFYYYLFIYFHLIFFFFFLGGGGGEGGEDCWCVKPNKSSVTYITNIAQTKLYLIVLFYGRKFQMNIILEFSDICKFYNTVLNAEQTKADHYKL